MDPRTERAVRTYVNYKLGPGLIGFWIFIAMLIGLPIMFGLCWFLSLFFGGH
jgi:hypothetical protein